MSGMGPVPTLTRWGARLALYRHLRKWYGRTVFLIRSRFKLTGFQALIVISSRRAFTKAKLTRSAAPTSDLDGCRERLWSRAAPRFSAPLRGREARGGHCKNLHGSTDFTAILEGFYRPKGASISALK